MDEKTIKIEEFSLQFFGECAHEIAIKIDDFVLECFKKYTYAYINKKIINFDNEVEYEYDEGDIMDLLVNKNNNNGIIVIPSNETINIIESGISLEVSIIHKYFVLNDECGKLFKFKTKQNSINEEIQKQTFNSEYIIDVFRNNANRICKVYITTDFPICFEFLNYKVFISPLD